MPLRTPAGISREECGTCRITGDVAAPGTSAKEAGASVMRSAPEVGGRQTDGHPASAERKRGARGVRGTPEDQARDASASFQVVDGRMILAALAGSGW
ncbi:hypothetical protein GCM10010348_69410 [Streptomyces anthocyanicus]|nr:hypothetical protein GCM10010391_57290 [Streptomyces anthocyanicus]GHC32627.1 hypothetical protein GCM10010348_69410 [Streptomyces anthocyanicus]